MPVREEKQNRGRLAAAELVRRPGAGIPQGGVRNGSPGAFVRAPLPGRQQRRFSLSLSSFDLALFLVLLPVSLVAIGFLVGRELPSLTRTARTLKFAGMEAPAIPSPLGEDQLADSDGNEVEPESVVDSVLPPDEVASARDGGSASPSLQNELKRIQQYENQLRKRATFLEAILDDLERMDYDFNEITSSSDAPRARTGRRRLGLGGADRSRAPIIHGPRSSALSGDQDNGATIEPEQTNAGPEKNPVGRPHLAPSAAKSETAGRKIPLLLQDLDAKLARIASVPLGAPVQGDLSSPFGYRRSPFSGQTHMHSGLDFAVERASSVIATADGTVIHAGRKGAYGNMVIVRHGRRVETLYGHLSRIMVEPGQRICRGQQIGQVGSTGRSTGPHLHYEVRIDGDAVDPARFVRLASFFRFIDPERGFNEFAGAIDAETELDAAPRAPAPADTVPAAPANEPSAPVQLASIELFHPFTHTASIPFLSGP